MQGLYYPQNEKDLREQYPDMWTIDEFKGLTSKDLLLTWYYSNPTSPFSDLDHVQAVEQSFLAVFKTHEKIPSEQISKWLERDFKTELKDAMDRWKNMKLGIRSTSKKMVEAMLENLQKMTNVTQDDFAKYDAEGNAVKGVDWQARTQYANFCRITSELLPQLIQQSEQGFGVTKIKGEKPKGSKSIDRFHQRNTLE